MNLMISFVSVQKYIVGWHNGVIQTKLALKGSHSCKILPCGSHKREFYVIIRLTKAFHPEFLSDAFRIDRTNVCFSEMVFVNAPIACSAINNFQNVFPGTLNKKSGSLHLQFFILCGNTGLYRRRCKHYCRVSFVE